MRMFAGHRPPPTCRAEGPTSRVRAAHCAIVIRVGRDFSDHNTWARDCHRSRAPGHTAMRNGVEACFVSCQSGSKIELTGAGWSRLMATSTDLPRIADQLTKHALTRWAAPRRWRCAATPSQTAQIPDWTASSSVPRRRTTFSSWRSWVRTPVWRMQVGMIAVIFHSIVTQANGGQAEARHQVIRFLFRDRGPFGITGRSSSPRATIRKRSFSLAKAMHRLQRGEVHHEKRRGPAIVARMRLLKRAT